MTSPAIIFEDEHLLIVDKPAGVVVHPAYKNPAGTLLDALAGDASRWSGDRRPSLVGRLDKPTSGLVLVAKSAEMHARLQRTLASPASDKIYLALVDGVTPERGTIDLPLASDPADRRRRVVSSRGAPSVTEFARIDAGSLGEGSVSLLECRLVTGRRHQIRVHLAARGWAIVGDATYGTPLDGFTRLALHAWRIAFTHPLSGARVDVMCPPPPDLERLLSRCGCAMRQNYMPAPRHHTSRL
jgi:23S rRNA pseudouridine1911/1915/1917 synthase